jgi:hypothetical protein
MPEPVVVPMPAPAPVIPMPAPAPAPAPVGNSPFATADDLMKYVVEKYKVLGPVKGAQIHQVLSEMGAATVASLPPESHAEFYKRVELL